MAKKLIPFNLTMRLRLASEKRPAYSAISI
jgi:hypothetical protein